MGNAQNNKKNQGEKEREEGQQKGQSYKSLDDVIDYIASYYILTMDFQSLAKLSEKEYCDKLIILTSDIIDKYFNDREITYLAQRVKNGVEVNEMTDDTIKYISRDNLDTEQRTLQKKRVCIGIAKFYVKIAHLFAAIAMTLNPVYVYKDEQGNKVSSNLLQKDRIPKNVERKIYKMNICDNRIFALQRGQDYKNIENQEINVHPKVCDFNNINVNGVNTVKTLNDEPGIPELMQLYLDDHYDYSTGTFKGMSEETQQQYQKDLKRFYTTFTGEDDMPENITKFSDIKLKNYAAQIGCTKPFTTTTVPAVPPSANTIAAPPLDASYRGSLKDKLFADYAMNIKNMFHTSKAKQGELLETINDVFVFVQDPSTDKKKVRINPKLTDELLQETIEKARSIIIDLYLKCETDFVKGVKIYEAIVQDQLLKTAQNQIKNLEKETNEIIQGQIGTQK